MVSSRSLSLRIWLEVLLLALLGTINFADKSIIGLAASAIIREFHLSSSQWGLIGSSFYLLFALSSMSVSASSEQIGTKNLIAFLAGFWSFLQFATVFLAGFLPLLLSRVLLGVGEGPAYGVSVADAASRVPVRKQGFVFSCLTLGSAVGPALLAPLLALSLLAFGWRMTFALLGGIGCFWLLCWLMLARDCRTIKLAAQHSSWKERLKEGLSYIRTKPVAFTIFAGFAAYWYLALLLTWEPLYFVQFWHLRVSNPLYLASVSLPWLVGGISQMGICWLSDRLYKRYGNQSRVWALTASLLLSALLLVGVALAPSPLVAVVCFALCPAGVAFPLVAILLGMAPTRLRATIQGIGVGLYSLAGLIAPGMTGLIIEKAGYLQAFILAAGIIGLAGLFCWLFVRVRGVTPPRSDDDTLEEASFSTLLG